MPHFPWKGTGRDRGHGECRRWKNVGCVIMRNTHAHVYLCSSMKGSTKESNNTHLIAHIMRDTTMET